MYGEDSVDNAQRYEHEASERDERHEREEEFRSDLPDYEDTESLMEHAEAKRDELREDGIAQYEMEQERNITHAQDNAI